MGPVAPTAARTDGTLAEWLEAHAHSVSERRLTLDVLGGALAAGAAALWRPAGWVPLLGAGLCFAAFGAWAAAERRLTAPAPHAGAWRALRGGAAVVGTLAAGLLVFGVMFGVLGTWIS
jgi:hypothetical protein